MLEGVADVVAARLNPTPNALSLLIDDQAGADSARLVRRSNWNISNGLRAVSDWGVPFCGRRGVPLALDTNYLDIKIFSTATIKPKSYKVSYTFTGLLI